MNGRNRGYKMAVKDQLIQTISDSLGTVRMLVATKFMKPMQEVESSTLPKGWVHLMKWMYKNGNVPVSMTDLSLAMQISKPNITPIIDRLCLDGFVKRIPDSNDKRIINVILTKKGTDFIQHQKMVLDAFLKDCLSLLKEDELEKLENALAEIATAIEIIEERGQHD